MADQVLYSGVACITDLMVKEGLINLDFADVRAVMRGMGKAMMGTGEASGDKRALRAAEAAIANPLLDDVSMKGARGLLISITGGATSPCTRSTRRRLPHPRGGRRRDANIIARRHLRRSGRPGAGWQSYGSRPRPCSITPTSLGRRHGGPASTGGRGDPPPSSAATRTTTSRFRRSCGANRTDARHLQL
jgi:hypothetical protein